MTEARTLSCITPPYILERLLDSRDAAVRNAALTTLLATSRLRGERGIRGMARERSAPAHARRTVSDCRTSTVLSSALVARTEDGPASADGSVNRAFDGFGVTRQFYRDVLGRDSIDDHGMRLDGYVHRGLRYNNAFWDGREMVFGDGDGRVFTDFTLSLDVIAHELTHGVTEHTAGLAYHNQSGALNEHVSDVMGSLVKQWSLRQTAEDADWLIGAEVFTPGVDADALRSMKAPGHAFDNDLFGKDPQPDHMRDYVDLPDTDEGDNGGVHINSGIPNKAFHRVAVGIGGAAWEAAGHIWYSALRSASPGTQFQEFAESTHAAAARLHGSGSTQQEAVRAGWSDVGIDVTLTASGQRPGNGRAPAKAAGPAGPEGELARAVAGLGEQLQDLARRVRGG